MPCLTCRLAWWPLPFLIKTINAKVKPSIDNVLPEFEEAIIGGIQLELVAGSTFKNDQGQGLFEGYTFQLVNLYDQSGMPAKSTLGQTPTKIFNQEFLDGRIYPQRQCNN